MFTHANASGVRYDSRRNRWLPAGIPTPDGTGYVYADKTGAVHAVNVDSGLDRVIVDGSWAPLGIVGNRLYLAEERLIPQGEFGGGGYAEVGLSQTDLSGGTPTVVTKHAGFWWLSSLGGWTVDRVDGLQQAPDRVLHLDLSTGVIQPWLSGIGNVTLAGFDPGGHPFAVGQAGVQVLLLEDPHTSRTLYVGSRENGWPAAPALVDGEGVWFSGFSIKDPTFEAPTWLYRPDTGLQHAVGIPGSQVSVAGPCR